MNAFLRYPLVLALVTGVSGLALYATYAGTKDAIKKQEVAARTAALKTVFPLGFGATEEVKDAEKKLLFTKVWLAKEATGEPDYYVAEGSAVGYNSSVPVRILAGFANPAKAAAGAKKGLVLVGWAATGAEETPGLGQKIVDKAAANTLVDIVTGQSKEPKADRRTGFQKQFADPDAGKVYTAEELTLTTDGGPLEPISGATITSRAVIKAIQDASAKLQRALEQ